jgi:Protein of unknown function (DUF3618)
VGQSPSQIRQDIEETRARMGDTVEALSYRTDVKTRAKDAVSDRVDTVKEKFGAATPDGADVKRGARRAAGIAQENPIGLALGAVAVGFVAGLAMPSTRVEDERMGELADQVKDRAAETGREALERGKQVAQDAAETVQESGREHAQQLKESQTTN